MTPSPPTDAEIAAHLDRLCKPPGSLGTIETIAARLMRIQHTLTPQTRPRRVVIFAADHGVTAEGVSAWPGDVTAAVASVMTRQRTASGVFADQLDCSYHVVDAGLLTPIGDRDEAIPAGTANLRIEPAMTPSQFDAAWALGKREAEQAASDGCRLVIGGEMGIGNTTAASCLVAMLAGHDDIDQLVGRGAGVDDAGLDRKRRVVADAIDRVDATDDAREIGRQLGGLEIVALAGFYAAAAASGLTILVDGFIATAALLLAERLAPGTAGHCLAGHRSVEPGHVVALASLGLDAILDLNLRLGEGTGALAALPLLDLAAALPTMATLDEVTP